MMIISLCQTKILKEKKNNMKKAKLFIKKSKEKNAKIIVLPELFTCPYNYNLIKKYAEYENEETFNFLKEESKDCILVGGSIVEKDKNGLFYNTSYSFENKKLIGKYRKINLFNIFLKKNNMNESKYFMPGNNYTVLNTSFGKIAILICFDIRFPELFIKIKKEKNPFLYILPTNFNNITGPAHLEILAKSRAIDFQSFIAITSCAYSNKYNSYGHSMLIDPWGNILKKLNKKEDILIHKINIKKIENARKKIKLNY